MNPPGAYPGEPATWTKAQWARMHQYAQALGKVGPKADVCPPCPETDRLLCFCKERGKA